ncbi:hypothetical protein QVD17_31543 [Tagetes erecta]|uniref:Coilin tudor domain-containing protein n=1 Tax=Tagetes erecta TaxID=13708 RepID=A0AAD8NNY3_TARER|nr:hypothetical protein QVD17_31543 [Tagetes erecta]
MKRKTEHHVHGDYEFVTNRIGGGQVTPISEKRIKLNVEIKKENVEIKKENVEISDNFFEENVAGVRQMFTEPVGAKKVPSRSARRKKHKRERMRELAKISQNGNNDESLSQIKISKKIMIIPIKEIKKEYDETSYTSIRDNVEGVKKMSTAPDGAIEVPSRSAIAMRKNVKRWGQEVAKILQNSDTHEYTNGINQSNKDESLTQKKFSQKKIIPNVVIKKENVETHDINIGVNVEGAEQMSAAPDGAKKPDTHEYTNEINQSSKDESITQRKFSQKKIIPNAVIKKENVETHDINIGVNVEGAEQTSTAPDGAKKVPSRSTRRKRAKRRRKQAFAKVSPNICKEMIIPNEEIKKENTETCDKNIRDNVEGVKQTSAALDGAKKVPSRSAKRKQAKRRWRQEVAKISQNPATHDYTNEVDQSDNDESLPRKKICKKNIIPNEIKKKTVETHNKNIGYNVEGAGLMSTALDGVKKVASGSTRRKKAKRIWKQELTKTSRSASCYFKVEISKKNIIPNEEIKRENAETCDKNIRLNIDRVEQTSNAPDGAKKFPSRNARKKKAKRRWRRQLDNISQNLKRSAKESSSMLNVDTRIPLVDLTEFDKFYLPKKGGVIAYRVIQLSSSWTPELSSFRVGRISYYDAENIVLMPVPEYPSVFAKMDPDNSLYNEDESLEIKIKDLADVRSIEPSSSDAVKAVSNGLNLTPQGGEKTVASNLMSNSNDAKVNLYKDPSTDGDKKQIKLPDAALQWNGITKKRKGQKWGLEKFSSFERGDLQKTTNESSSMLTVDTRIPAIDLIEFDLLPLCNSPKIGDVIAYRVLELSSSWTPELSSFRVGKISFYDANNIVLMPVPEYPIVFTIMDPVHSLYKEDGSLEIKFASLVDVRSIEQSNSDAEKAVSNGVNPTPQGGEKNAASNLLPNSNDDKANLYKDPSPVVDNKDGYALAEIDKLVSAKKSELLEVNQEELKKDSGWIKWPYKGNALGPTMALLRSKSII